MKRENYYKCYCNNPNFEKKFIWIDVLENRIKFDDNIFPVGDFDVNSSLTQFLSENSDKKGYSYKKFFAILKKFIDEDMILDIHLNKNVLHIVTQRFSDRFCRNVETFNIVFNDMIGYSIFFDNEFRRDLEFLISTFEIKKTYHYKAPFLIESNYAKRTMYKQFFMMFDDYVKNNDYNFERFFVSPEEFIEFCEENAYLLISDYYEFNKKKIFSAHSGDGTISYYDSENDISSGKFGSKVLSVYSKNPSLAKNILKVGGAVGKVFGCKYLYDIKVINIFEQKFNKMISDIKSKYFVMGYEDEDVKVSFK